MIYKIKKIFLLIFLFLLQSCSGGTIGNFLETSFDNLDNINKSEERKDVLENKKLLNQETKVRKKKNIKATKKEERKDVLENKKLLNQEIKVRKKKNIKATKKEKRKDVLENKKLLNQETKVRKKKDIKVTKKEERKDVLENKKVLKLEKKSDKTNKNKKVNNSLKKSKNELQSYKILFILKDVNPQDPIKEFSTILRNSKVNFEIEKIERFLD